MRLFFKSKDGGPESNVTGYWLIECKSLFSIVLLRFDQGSREAFHNHAFNAVSFIFSGILMEEFKDKKPINLLDAISGIPKVILTKRDTFHKVHGVTNRSWVLSFRGPWSKTWNEFFQDENKLITLTNGRKIVNNDTPKNSNN